MKWISGKDMSRALLSATGKHQAQNACRKYRLSIHKKDVVEKHAEKTGGNNCSV